jgi:hypothetical protein
MHEIAKKQQHHGREVRHLRLQELMEEVVGQIESVGNNLRETEEVNEPWVGFLELAALGLTETKDWTSRVESDAAGLRTAMADGSAKVEEVQ